jgi:nucleotide-binding universal stress UspA family protein
MKLPTSILVPTDFGDASSHALDYATALAATFTARVHLVHAIGIPELGVPELGVAIGSTMIKSLVRDGQDALGRLVEHHPDRARLGEAVLRVGDPRDVILAVAAELGVDLIVMGTHGRRGLARAILGSVAESVVRASPCPVLTLNTRAAQP